MKYLKYFMEICVLMMKKELKKFELSSASMIACLLDAFVVVTKYYAKSCIDFN